MLYHRDVYWEDWFDGASRNLVLESLNFTKHMMEHFSSKNDARYDYTVSGVLNARRNLLHFHYNPFEVELINGVLTKAVYRVGYDKTRDISIVFRRGVIITAWLNNKTDSHSTLDVSRYTRIV